MPVFLFAEATNGTTSEQVVHLLDAGMHRLKQNHHNTIVNYARQRTEQAEDFTYIQQEPYLATLLVIVGKLFSVR